MKKTLLNLITIIAILVLATTGFSQRRSGGSFGGSSRSSYGSSRTFTSTSSRYGATRSTSNYNRTRSYSRPTTSYRSSLRVGYRPSVSVHFYGHPYVYGGRSLYWYGGGYYAYYPGGPLMLGVATMPGYNDSYGYDPGMVAPAPVNVNRALLALFVAVGIFLIFFILFWLLQ